MSSFTENTRFHFTCIRPDFLICMLTFGVCSVRTLNSQSFSRKDWISRYFSFIFNKISKGYARKVPLNATAPKKGKVWYLPHHAVYHPKKPDKVRVVFDCSARFEDGARCYQPNAQCYRCLCPWRFSSILKVEG